MNDSTIMSDEFGIELQHNIEPLNIELSFVTIHLIYEFLPIKEVHAKFVQTKTKSIVLA